MTNLMTYSYTTSHIYHKSQVFSSLLTTRCDPQRSVSPWSAWRPEASAPRKSRPRWACHNRQRSGTCLRRLNASVAARGSYVEQWSWDFASYHAKTQRKNTSLSRHLTPWHSPQRQTTRGKTMLFCDASWTKKIELPEPVPKTLISSPLAHFFLPPVPQMVENSAKMRRLEISKKKKNIFAKCTFPWVRNTFLKQEVLNNMHFWSIHCVFHLIFCTLQLWCL